MAEIIKNTQLRKLFKNKKPVTMPGEAVMIAREMITDPHKEHQVLLYLDAMCQCIGAETVGIGIINASLVHPREIFGGALAAHAFSFVMLHNHPSGHVKASKADKETYHTLRASAKTMCIEMVDYIIFSMDGSWNSIRGAIEMQGKV